MVGISMKLKKHLRKKRIRIYLGSPYMSIGYKYERAAYKTSKRTHACVSIAHDERNLQLNYHLWGHTFFKNKEPTKCDSFTNE
jgi:hypothetical protein